MNINAVRLVSIGVITGFVAMCKDLQHTFLNAHALILFSLAMTHYHLSDRYSCKYWVPAVVLIISGECVRSRSSE